MCGKQEDNGGVSCYKKSYSLTHVFINYISCVSCADGAGKAEASSRIAAALSNSARIPVGNASLSLMEAVDSMYPDLRLEVSSQILPSEKIQSWSIISRSLQI